MIAQTMTATLHILLQWIDSAFPAGAFGHSGGMESMWQSGQIASPDDLGATVSAMTRQQLRFALPFVMEAHRSPESLPAIDALLNAMLINHVANHASRQQGQAMLASASKVFDGVAGSDVLKSARRECACHFASVFGAIARSMGIPIEETAEAFLFTTIRMLTSAAVRLGIVGPIEAQQIQLKVCSDLKSLLVGAPKLAIKDAVQIAPIMEIIHASHDRLYSRLFVS